MTHTYSITLVDDGEVGGTDIEATNLQEAWENALKWAEEGDWPDAGCVVHLQVERLDDQGKVVEEREENAKSQTRGCTLTRTAYPYIGTFARIPSTASGTQTYGLAPNSSPT